MNVLISINQDQLEKLGPSIEALGLSSPPKLISLDWDNPHRKQAVYQVATEEDLEKMVTEFNKLLESEEIEMEFKSPAELSAGEQWTMLEWLNNNAMWSERNEFLETWLEGDKHLIEEELNKNPELVRSVSRTEQEFTTHQKAPPLLPRNR